METKKEIRELFAEKKTELTMLKRADFERGLTQEEQAYCREIQLQLLQAIWPLAGEIIHRKLSEYPVTREQVKEAQKQAQSIFRQKLMGYDPESCSPEVYFSYYFELCMDNYIIRSIRKNSITQEQMMFILGKDELANFARIREERPLTPKEKAREDSVKEDLFRAIWRYAKLLSGQIMGKYITSSDAYNDVMQSIAEIFFRQLPRYNPYQTTPTTYFSRYFKQVIDEYVHKDSQHLSQYDAHNVSKVRAAIHYYDTRGVKWDEEMLMNYTQLSRKVLKNTLYLAHNSKRADVDACINLDSGIPTPEEACIENEFSTLLNQVLFEELTEEERRIFFTRVNLGGNRELPYDTVASVLNMPVRDVKKSLSAILARLQNNETLRYLHHGDRPIQEVTLNMQKKIEKETEKSIYDGFANVRMSS